MDRSKIGNPGLHWIRNSDSGGGEKGFLALRDIERTLKPPPAPDHFELIISDQHAKGGVTIRWAWGALVN